MWYLPTQTRKYPHKNAHIHSASYLSDTSVPKGTSDHETLHRVSELPLVSAWPASRCKAHCKPRFGCRTNLWGSCYQLRRRELTVEVDWEGL